jgi:hypothetical protein
MEMVIGSDAPYRGEWGVGVYELIYSRGVADLNRFFKSDQGKKCRMPGIGCYQIKMPDVDTFASGHRPSWSSIEGIVVIEA